MKFPKKGRLVIVKWLDATSAQAWYEKGDTLPLCVNRTVGWLTGKHKDRIIVTAALSDGDSQFGIRQAIPVENVQDVRKLNIGKRP